MHPRAQMFLDTRAKAEARGDRGVVRCMNVELARMGYQDPQLETAVPEDIMERAVPTKGGRPRLPRCEHDQIVGRCVECEDDHGDDQS